MPSFGLELTHPSLITITATPSGCVITERWKHRLRIVNAFTSSQSPGYLHLEVVVKLQSHIDLAGTRQYTAQLVNMLDIRGFPTIGHHDPGKWAGHSRGPLLRYPALAKSTWSWPVKVGLSSR